LGGTGARLTFGGVTPGFVIGGTTNKLQFGTGTAQGVVDFQNDLDLGDSASTTRNVEVAKGSKRTGVSGLDAILSGDITVAANYNFSQFQKEGGGVLMLTGDNSAASPDTYTNVTTNGGILIFGGDNPVNAIP